MTNLAEKIRRVVERAKNELVFESGHRRIQLQTATRILEKALTAQLDATIEEMEADIAEANENLGVPGYDQLRHNTYVAAIERHLNPLKEARTSITNSKGEDVDTNE